MTIKTANQLGVNVFADSGLTDGETIGNYPIPVNGVIAGVLDKCFASAPVTDTVSIDILVDNVVIGNANWSVGDTVGVMDVTRTEVSVDSTLSFQVVDGTSDLVNVCVMCVISMDATAFM